MTRYRLTRPLITAAGLVLVLALAACGQQGRRGGDVGGGRGAVEDGEFAGGVDDVGTDACESQHRKFMRFMDGRMGERLKGPAADRRDVAYGSHAREKLDVFLPKQAAGKPPAPIIVMVHGGGWCVGDKSLKSVTANKVDHWVARGFVLVSVNYPMVTDGRRALGQAEDVARAVAFVQRNARDWGGDGSRVVLMGHSAGAHLVSLVNADARMRDRLGVKPVLGTVSIDSGATDVVKQIQGLKAQGAKERFLEAFGTREDEWRQASPYHQLSAGTAPWLGICSTRRPDDSCGQARAFAEKARSLGVRAEVRPYDKGHGPLNGELGEPGSYTSGVDDFIAGLEPSLRSLLSR